MTKKTTKTSKRRKLRRDDPAARTRPAFADAYPRDDALDELVVAFERGNFRLVRSEAEDLAERTDDEAVRRAAMDLRRRLDPDPASLYLLGIGVALVVFLYGYYLMSAH